jgi:hypothetical protein
MGDDQRSHDKNGGLMGFIEDYIYILHDYILISKKNMKKMDRGLNGVKDLKP